MGGFTGLIRLKSKSPILPKCVLKVKKNEKKMKKKKYIGYIP
jgi:hypothetical protein